jgi:VWFA-related protein
VTKRAFRIPLVIVLVLTGAIQGTPQNPPPAQPPAQAANPQASYPALRSVTHLVQINVVVEDKKGNPVTDLTKDDFEVVDQGKPQTISVFSMESTRILPPSSTPPPPNVYSNRIDQQSGPPTSITVILIDALNTHFFDMNYARQELTKYLKQIQPQDRVALYGLTDRLKVLHEFTNDATSLIAALNQVPTVETPQMSASGLDPSNTGDDDLDTFLDTANQKVSDFMTINRATTTAKALQAIAEHIARLPGRKNLIWVSGGFPLDFGLDEMDINSTRDARSFNEDIERAARSLNDANVAIYPVDARGLIGMPSSLSASSRGPVFRAQSSGNSMSTATRGRTSPTSAPPANSMTINPDSKIFDTMNILAERTGGRASYNSNDIQGAIRRAIDDSRVTYVLGFYPGHGQWNGKFHEIKIKLRRPGTNIRYRRGYFAFADVAPADEQKRSALLRDALAFPIDSSSLGLSVSTKPVDVPGAQTLKITVTVEARDVVFDPQGDRLSGAVDFYFVQLGGKNDVIAGENRRITATLPQEGYQNIL